jgi:hypothetical protein
VTEVTNAPQLVRAAEEQEAEERVVAFEIDGEPYDCPRLDDLDLDEELILWEIGHVALPDFMPAHPESPAEVKTAVELVAANRTRHPGFKRALVHIAYRRRNPEITFAQIEERVGKVNGLDAELALYGKAREAEQEDSAKPDPPNGR